MNATEFWSLYCKKWNSEGTTRCMKRREGTWKQWTKAMTRLLHEIGKTVQQGLVVVDKSITKKEQEEWGLGGRQEYMGLDGMWLPSQFAGGENGEWCLPDVVIEHQSYEPNYSEEGAAGRFALCLWKLLCTRSKLRVLIAYMPPEDFKRTREKLKNDVLGLLEPDGISQVLLIFETNGPIGEEEKTEARWYCREQGADPSGHHLRWEG